jgi:hypothetical protein
MAVLRLKKGSSHVWSDKLAEAPIRCIKKIFRILAVQFLIV